MRRFLFPSPPRSFRGQRAVKIGLRALHVLAVGGLFGAVATGASEAFALGWWHASLTSGAAILALDCFETLAFALQLRGLVVFAKLAALLLLPLDSPYATQILGALILLSVVSSHAPAAFRYRIWLPGAKVEGSKSRG